jgi:predicted esterase
MHVSRMVVGAIVISGYLTVGIAFGGEPAPGNHKRIACKGNPAFTYNLRIPAAYAAEPKRKFPVLFTCGPGGNPGFMRMDAWAEKRGVIIVAVNNTKNGMETAEWDAIQADVVDSVESTLRLHSCLRFSMGMSGGAMAGMRLANQRNDKHAGILMLGHSGNYEDKHLAKHIAVAFVHGEKDTVQPPSFVRRIAKGVEDRGNPVRIISGEWGHTWGPHEHHVTSLDWMLNLQRLIHPKLPPAERKAAAAEVVRRAKALGKIADAAARLEEAEMLLALPETATRRNMKELHAGWFSATFELAEAEGDAVAKHAALSALSEDKRIARCASGDKRKLSRLLRKLRRKSPAKEEWAARRLVLQVEFMEGKAGKSKLKKTRVAQSYAMIAKKYADTAAGRKAAEAVKRIVAELSEEQ